MVVPLPCFVKPNSLPFPKVEVARLAKTTPDNIVKIHHWRYSAWVERGGCLPITVSLRRLSTWLPKLHWIINHCKSWRRLSKLWESLDADFAKYPDVYPPEVQSQLHQLIQNRRDQLQQSKPRPLLATHLVRAYEQIIRTTQRKSLLDNVLPMIRQHDALWQQFPHLLQQLKRALWERHNYLLSVGAL